MARMTGSWLSGPAAALPKGEEASEEKYRGARLGLPESGPGSLAGWGQRAGALLVDWLIGLGIVSLFVHGAENNGLRSAVGMAVWAVVGIIGVWLFARTPGQALAGIGVAREEGPVRVGFVRALARIVLLIFIVPALVTDKDARGLHDRATQTVLIRTR